MPVFHRGGGIQGVPCCNSFFAIFYALHSKPDLLAIAQGNQAGGMGAAVTLA